MIVKNEAANLPRLLESVAPFVNCYAIVDTGSTDGTEAIIAHSLVASRGAVVHAPFVDFSQARNAALDLARMTAESGDLQFDYVLLADADMQLVVDGDDFPAIDQPLYDVMQLGGDLAYDNVRLIRRDMLAQVKYLEPTHEYLSSPVPPSPRLAGVHFIDHATGSNRVDKFERDVRLLTGALEKDPSNARAMFYLAETYRFMGGHADAIALYDARASAGGWDEEVWYARYQAARCCLDLGREREGMGRALEAYELRPSRLEPLLLLSRHQRMRGRNATAAMIAREMINRDATADRLFVEGEANGVGGARELSISGFYSPRRETRAEARAACLALATDRDAPEYARSEARTNCQHYARRLAQLAPSTKIAPIVAGPLHGYDAALNPSIAVHEGTTLVNLRRVNYAIDRQGRYHVGGRPFQDGDQIRTQNQLFEHPSLVSQVSTLADGAGGDRNDFYVRGYEDLRIFSWRGELWGTATVRDRHPDGNCEIALVRIEPTLQAIAEAHVLAPPPGHEGRTQKNWVPAVHKDQLFLVYAADPTVVMSVNAETFATRVEPHLGGEPKLALDHLRGSSQAIPFASPLEPPGAEYPHRGFLYVAHEAIDRENDERRYLHRFVYLDGMLAIAAVSEPFWFQHPGIEFCAGLAQVDEKTLVLSYGVRDAAAFTATVDMHEVSLLLSRDGLLPSRSVPL